MHIILVSDRLATTRTVTITARHLLGMVFVLTFLVLLFSGVLSYVSLQLATKLNLSFLQPLLVSVQQKESEKNQSFVRENLNMMAVKLGQMQAQLLRLDALGERLGALSGIKPQEFRLNEQPGRGGTSPSNLPQFELSSVELSKQLDFLSKQLENRSDYLGLLESKLLDERIKKKLIPTVKPVNSLWSASNFGWRIDPFTGALAMHEGIDFIAEKGTPIMAAADGLVTVAEFHPQYGNMIEIDHGNDFSTRYAHASKLLVKPGEVTRRGQKIAEIGTTGRSTGPHLHFEVRYKGVPQNPAKFLHAAKVVQ